MRRIFLSGRNDIELSCGVKQPQSIGIFLDHWLVLPLETGRS
jgi:hypothetical protein